MPDSILCTVDEACAELRLSKVRVYELLSSGELASIKVGRARRVPREALVDFVERHLTEGAV